jgi:hypothetical protein
MIYDGILFRPRRRSILFNVSFQSGLSYQGTTRLKTGETKNESWTNP